MKALHLLALAALFAACDKVENPIQAGDDGTTPPPPEETVQKVLLEEYTGHKCPTCPAAHVIAASLSATYGDRLIIVGEHVSSLANPEPGTDYDTDFRTAAGNAYFAKWYSDVIPRGLFNRTAFNGNVPLSSANWANAINDLIGQVPTMRVEFSAFAFNSATNTVTTTVTCTPLVAVDHDLNLTVQLIEDHVIDYQYNAAATPPDIPEYDHRHVLRDNLNGTWGEPLVTGSAPASTPISKSFTYTLPANVVNASHCALVAYVWNAPGTTGEYQALQVEEKKFQP